MSGFLDTGEASAPPNGDVPGGLSPGPVVELLTSRVTDVGGAPVRRALPNRGRRTVGAWCFADHFGPMVVHGGHGFDIGPHPHMGLQTVTWLVAGEVLHRDSLGSEQAIRPGELNLMTAGHGVSHAEQLLTGYDGLVHGVQLWVAQPAATREGPPAFSHHTTLPVVDLDGDGRATVLLGELAGERSPARRDTDHVGAELVLGQGTSTIPLVAAFEHALVVVDGTVTVNGKVIGPGTLAYLGTGRDELVITSPATSRALLLGGTPFDERLVMWWNFVARTTEEIGTAYREWSSDSGRFGTVVSPLAHVETSPPPWSR